MITSGSAATAATPERAGPEAPSASAADIALARAEWQSVLFAAAPQRRSLLALAPRWPTRAFGLRVHRNHAFEPVASVLAPYLAYAGYRAEVAYSSYDDSLSFSTPGSADVELLWLDFARYRALGQESGLAAWLTDRLAALRAQSGAPILVPDFAEDSEAARAFNRELRDLTAALPGVYVCDQAAVAAALGAAYVDVRAAAIVGTSVSNAGCLHTARLLGSRWIPGVLAPRLKAIVLDLDNTLYAGVLGEDGTEGVRLTDDHAALQHRLVELGREGMLLALCSRNEAADVQALFAGRPDFPLRPEHLAAMEISWDHKAAAIGRIADALRIGTDAVLFVDDNPGELAAVLTALPGVRPLYAGPEAGETLRALAFYPGLHRWRDDATDTLRAKDLEASRQRASLGAHAADPAEYLRSLEVRLEFTKDAREELDRLADLSNKTNQFNLSLRRLTPAEVGQFIDAPERSAVSIRLADRLSDSGIIGAVFTRCDGDSLLIEDLCISCRALGRQLEDVMITEAIRLAMGTAGPTRWVRFRRADGPRNQPARDWLGRFLGPSSEADAEGWVTMAWDDAAGAGRVAEAPVTVSRRVSA